MRILLIGALNLHRIPQGGEEYKNQLLYQYLCINNKIVPIDTHRWKQRPIVIQRLLINVLFVRYDRIIISASSHSVYRLVQILQFFPKIASNTIYFVVGGFFPNAVITGNFKIKPYKSLKSIVVQGTMLKETLEQAGYTGKIHVLPNFKRFPSLRDKTLRVGNHIKFLFLSRIHPDKGIHEIFEASKLLRIWGIQNFSITFYGPIEPSFREWFENSLPPETTYSGVLDIINKETYAYNLLSTFDVMLFPTYWKGEGFPGALVDAFASGLPVIATDWNMNKEIIEHERNGLLIPPKDAKALAIAMRKLIEDRQLLHYLSEESSRYAKRYHVDALWPEVTRIISS